MKRPRITRSDGRTCPLPTARAPLPRDMPREHAVRHRLRRNTNGREE